MRLPPRPRIPYLILGGTFPLRTFAEIIVLFAISRLHVRVIVLPHIELDRYLLPLTQGTKLAALRTMALVAGTSLLLIQWRSILPPLSTLILSSLFSSADTLIVIKVFSVLTYGWWPDNLALQNAHGAIVVQSRQVFTSEYQILNLRVSCQPQLVLRFDLRYFSALTRLSSTNVFVRRPSFHQR